MQVYIIYASASICPQSAFLARYMFPTWTQVKSIWAGPKDQVLRTSVTIEWRSLRAKTRHLTRHLTRLTCPSTCRIWPQGLCTQFRCFLWNVAETSIHRISPSTPVSRLGLDFIVHNMVSTAWLMSKMTHAVSFLEPSDVQNLTVVGMTNDSATLKWSKSEGNRDFYLVHVKCKLNISRSSFDQKCPCEVCTINNLVPGYEYEFTVTAVVNESFEGVPSSVSDYTSKCRKFHA